MEVPDRKFTYLPTALLEEAGTIGGTGLRVILVVLRKTWGWTDTIRDPDTGNSSTVHVRWAEISTKTLSEDTGRCETSVKQSVGQLQGEWIERICAGSYPYQYRFLPEAVGADPNTESSFSGDSPNDLTPDPQQTDPPSYSIESFSDRQPSGEKNEDTREPCPSEPGSAVPENQTTNREKPDRNRSRTKSSPPNGSSTNLENLSPEKRDMAEKLSNVGVWEDRISEVIEKFTLARIRANFQLYRKRSAEQEIQTPGAWLYRAIVEGYTLPNPGPERTTQSDSAPSETDSTPTLEHKQVVSKSEKEIYVSRGVPEEQFHRCLSGENQSEEPQFMYFDPAEGGPNRRV
jgi:hypothetical protein